MLSVSDFISRVYPTVKIELGNRTIVVNRMIYVQLLQDSIPNILIYDNNSNIAMTLNYQNGVSYLENRRVQLTAKPHLDLFKAANMLDTATFLDLMSFTKNDDLIDVPKKFTIATINTSLLVFIFVNNLKVVRYNKSVGNLKGFQQIYLRFSSRIYNKVVKDPSGLQLGGTLSL